MGLDMFIHNNGAEVAYWRKANQIHKWFEDHAANGNLENLEDYPITKENLIELKDTCEKVLSDHSLASKLLPRQEGFFFGGTEYDKWYFEDLKDTIKQIDDILEITDFENDKLIYSAWW